MEKKFRITRQEMDEIRDRAQDIMCVASQSDNMTEGFLTYAQDHGYTREEAQQLVEQTIIPTVNQYNIMCRSRMKEADAAEVTEGDADTWVLDRISERVEGMDLNEECRFKIAALIALRCMGTQVLEDVTAGSPTDLDAAYEAILEETYHTFDAEVYTEEMLGQINAQLAEAVENCGMDLALSEQMAQIFDMEADDTDIRIPILEMWKDEQLKYCSALAACIAKKNGELPSMPADTTDEAMVLGICEGIDIIEVEARVARGEMAADRAYKIIRTIAEVALVILLLALFTAAVASIAVATMEFVLTTFGSGIIASFTAAALGGVVLFGAGETVKELVGTAKDIFIGVCDIAYAKLKKAAGAVSGFAREKVLPKLKDMLESTKAFLYETTGRLRSYVSEKRKARNVQYA